MLLLILRPSKAAINKLGEQLKGKTTRLIGLQFHCFGGYCQALWLESEQNPDTLHTVVNNRHAVRQAHSLEVVMQQNCAARVKNERKGRIRRVKGL